MIRTACALGCLILATACATPPRWMDVVVDRPFGEIWDGFVAIAERQGYIMDRRASDRGLRQFVSHWRESPAPFGMGSRTRLHGKFGRPDPTEDGHPVAGWKLEFRVERQVVKDMAPGFEPEESDWTDGGQDGTREEVLAGQLRLRFGQSLGVDPSFERSR